MTTSTRSPGTKHGWSRSPAARISMTFMLPLLRFFEGRDRRLDPYDEKDDDSPLRPSCSQNALIWKLYMEHAKDFDKNLAELFNSDLDSLLIFAGLFSAILSAFLIEIRKGLQEDLQTVTNSLLTSLLNTQTNGAVSQASTPQFTPSTSTRWINGLWFLSLIFSLVSALGASVAKGWVTQFSSVSGSSWSDASLHCRRLRSVYRWHLKFVIQALPILIHMAFFLFGAGLVILLFQDDPTIAIITLVLTVYVGVMYLGNSIVSASYSDFPLRTPVADLIRCLIGPRKPGILAAAPSREDACKVQALSWLLSQSLEVGTMKEALFAVAGLPFTMCVQGELYRGPAAAIVSSQLSSELAKSFPDAQFLRAALYSLLHLVQGPVNEAEAETATIFSALVDKDGALYDTSAMPTRTQGLALVLKARIIHFLDDPALLSDNLRLFETDVPVLTKACGDPHLRRSLHELEQLRSTRPPVKYPPQSFWVTGLGFSSAATKQTFLNAFSVLRNASIYPGTGFVARKVVQDMLGLLDTKEEEVGNVILKTFLSGLQHDDFRNAITIQDTVWKISYMLEIPWSCSRHVLFKVIVALSQDEKLRTLIGTPANAQKIIAFIEDEDSNIGQEALKSLVALTQHGDFRSVVATPSVMQKFASLLESRNKFLRQDVLDSLKSLSKYEDVQVAISISKIVDKILSLLDAFESPVREDALSSLVDLSQHQTIRVAFFRLGAAQKIITMLDDADQDMRRDVLNSITTQIQFPEMQEACTAPGILAKLAAKLEDSDSSTRQGALKFFVALSKQENAPAVISAVQRILPLLKDPSQDVQECALNSVLSISHNDDFRATIITPNTVNDIVGMLKVDGLRKSALETLIKLSEQENVCYVPDIEQTMMPLLIDTSADLSHAALCVTLAWIKHDNIPQVINSMLQHELLHVRLSAVKFVAHSVQDSKLSGSLMLNSAQKVVSMLEDPVLTEPEVVESEQEDSGCSIDPSQTQLGLEILCAALTAIAELSQRDDLRIVVGAPESLQKLVNVLQHFSGDVQIAARDCLLKLTQHENVCAALATDDILEKLVMALMHQASYELMVDLSQHESIRAAMARPKTIHVIVDSLEHKSSSVRATAIKFLATLSQDEIIRAAIVDNGTIPKILTMRQHLDWLLRHNKPDSVMTVLQYENIRSTIASAEIMDRFSSVMDHSDWHVRHAALLFITALSQYSELRNNIAIHSIISKIILALDDSHQYVRRAAYDSLIDLCQYEIFRTTLAELEIIQKLALISEDRDKVSRDSALQCILDLSQYQEFAGSIASQNVMSNIFYRLEDPDGDVRLTAFKSILNFVQHDSGLRAVVAAQPVSQVFTSMLEGADIIFRQAALQSVPSLLRHDDTRALILNRDAVHKISVTLDDPDPYTRHAALGSVTALLGNVVLGPLIATPYTVHKILFLLKDPNPMVQHAAAQSAATLSSTGIGMHPILTLDIIVPLLGESSGYFYQSLIVVLNKMLMEAERRDSGRKVGRDLTSMLLSPVPTVRRGALASVAECTKHTSIGIALLEEELLPRLTWLATCDSLVQHQALAVIVTLAQKDYARSWIPASDAMNKLLPLLDHQDNNTCWWTICALRYLGRDTQSVAIISEPKVVHKIGIYLVNPNEYLRWEVLQYLSLLLSHDGPKTFLSSPESLIYFLDMLDGREGDASVLAFLRMLLEKATADGDVLAIGAILIQQATRRLEHANANVRESYTNVIMALEPSFALSVDDRERIISLLRNQNVAVLQCTTSIVQHFSKNIEFQQAVLETNIWEGLLQRPDTAALVLEILQDFFQKRKNQLDLHRGPPAALNFTQVIQIGTSSGLVTELLNMLRGGANDLDRWETGVKGLLALGVI